MASKARELAELIGNAGGTSEQVLAGRRNLIINGGFDVWQRGTSFGNLATANFCADRWASGTSQAGTISRESFAVGQTDVDGAPEYYLRWYKTGTGDWSALAQKIENVRQFDGQTVTLSFWAKADANVTSKVWLTSHFGSGGSTSVSTTLEPFTTTTTWQKFTFTFDISSFAGKTLGTGSSLQLTFSPDGTVASWTGTWDVANVQLELGSVATPFEHRSYGEELALCQRYYQRITASGYAYRIAAGSWSGPSDFAAMLQLPVPMRSGITFSTGPDSADTNWSVTANGVIKTGISNMTGADYSEEHAVVRLEVNFSSSVAGGGYEGQLRAKQNPTNNPYIALDAEL